MDVIAFLNMVAMTPLKETLRGCLIYSLAAIELVLIFVCMSIFGLVLIGTPIFIIYYFLYFTLSLFS